MMAADRTSQFHFSSSVFFVLAAEDRLGRVFSWTGQQRQHFKHIYSTIYIHFKMH